MRRVPRSLLLFSLLFTLSCNPDPEKPEQQARTLQPYPVHTLPLGIRLDSLQKILHGHSALFLSVVPDRMYRIIPLNAYGNQGYGAVELFADSTIRTYYWYSNIEELTADQRRYYSTPRPTVDMKPVLGSLTEAFGNPVKLEPYPNEEWYTWRNDTASINLTLQNKSITLTKSGAGNAIVPDTTRSKQVEPVKKQTVKPAPKKISVKKPAPKKQAVKKPVTKKGVAKNSVVKKPVVKKKAATSRR